MSCTTTAIPVGVDSGTVVQEGQRRSKEEKRVELSTQSSELSERLARLLPFGGLLLF